MTTMLQALTPELYTRLSRIEQRTADRRYAAWSARIPEIGPLFAAYRSYTQGLVSLELMSGIVGYGATPAASV